MENLDWLLLTMFANPLKKEEIDGGKAREYLENVCSGIGEQKIVLINGQSWLSHTSASFPSNVSHFPREIFLDSHLFFSSTERASGNLTKSPGNFDINYGIGYSHRMTAHPGARVIIDPNYERNGTMNILIPNYGPALAEVKVVKGKGANLLTVPYCSRDERDNVLWNAMGLNLGVKPKQVSDSTEEDGLVCGSSYLFQFGPVKMICYSKGENFFVVGKKEDGFHGSFLKKFYEKNGFRYLTRQISDSEKLTRTNFSVGKNKVCFIEQALSVFRAYARTQV